ncbi:MAG: hypothetical protein ACE5NG_01450 [bacterium]
MDSPDVMTQAIRIPACGFIFFISLGLFLPADIFGQEVAIQFSGYAKNLAIRTNSFFTKEPSILDISRLRTKGFLDVGSHLHSELWLDTELLAGNFLATPDFALVDSVERPTFVDLEWTLTQGNQYNLRQILFRAFATIYTEKVQITLGRQRIAWGTGFAWNPTDLLNPFNPAAIELEEKKGVDAVHVAVPLGALSRFEAAYAPGRNRLKSSSAVRVSSNFLGYDVSVMGGDFQDDKVLGGDFAGYIGGAGFRGEFAYTWKQGNSNFFRAILNADYNFPHDFYAFIEFYYNGQGSTNKNNYDIGDLFSGQTFNLAQHYLAASVSKNLTPLLGLNFYGIININDRSYLAGPAFTYSLATNLEIAVSAYFFMGSNDTEFGAQQSSYFAFVQYYF